MMPAAPVLGRLKSVQGFGWALGLILVANVVVMAGVYANRQGPPTSTMILSDREFNVLSSGRGESSGTTLQLRWHTPQDSDGKVLTRSRLVSIGFDEPEEKDIRDRDVFKVLPSRVAFVVLEYGGRAWARMVEQRRADLAKALVKARDDLVRKSLRDGFERFLHKSSRLVLIDAGINPDLLRERYPDRKHYLIVRARITAYWRYGLDPKTKTRAWHLGGHLTSLLPSTIHVPRILSDRLMTEQKTRYGMRRLLREGVEVTLDYGRRYEPWVAAVRHEVAESGNQ